MNETNDPMNEAPAAAAAGEAAADASAVQDVAALRAALEAARGEIAQLKDERLRALAEVENTRRRAARDRQDASQYAISAFARDLLAVADNLERALASVTAETRQADPQLDALMGGIEATERALKTTFERHGITPIAAQGAPFDPHRHEAMFEVPDSSVAHGTVVQVLEAGYTIHDRTLRPARVGVARGGPKAGSGGGGEPAEGGEEADDKLAFGAGRGYGQSGHEHGAGSRIDERS
ncbi:MAG: nucleotide exchange factor GrpE [Rhodospirillales bacterium]|nr:nucleotide exchange factor GrpE [Rhodospirillales bacterium]